MICPLCGKSTSSKNFAPNSLDLDVYSQAFIGLGRGKGFRSTGRTSILISSVSIMIKDRILDLLELFLKNDLMRREELEVRFGLTSSKKDESAALAAILEEKNQTINELRGEVSALDASKEEIVEAAKEIISLVEERLGSDWIYGYDDPLEELKHVIEKLIDEIMANQASMEENDDE